MLVRQRRQHPEGSPQAALNPVRVGCIEYLTARPLWQDLGNHSDLFSLKFAVPSEVSSWLHSGEVDLALVSSIEYGPDYRIVPGVAVTSMGSVASVASFSSKPITQVRTVALDSCSRTAAALMQILCAEWFDIEPEFVTMRPNLSSMLQRCDAALLIGDNTLFVDHAGMGLHKNDLCEEWRGLTSLPFVFGFWAGRRGVLTPEHLQALRDASQAGVTALDDIAGAHYPDNETLAASSGEFLQQNIRYRFDDDCIAGLQRFYESAAKHGIIQEAPTVMFYES